MIASLTLNTEACADTCDTMNLTWTWVCLISDTDDLALVTVVTRGHTLVITGHTYLWCGDHPVSGVIQCYVILQYYNITYKFTPLTLMASHPAVSVQLVIIIISMPTLHLDFNTFQSETKIKFNSIPRSSWFCLLFGIYCILDEINVFNVLWCLKWDHNDPQTPMIKHCEVNL